MSTKNLREGIFYFGVILCTVQLLQFQEEAMRIKLFC